MGNWTYYPTKLSTSALMQVRFLIGDTLSTDQQLQDEEINWTITQRSSVWGAAAECCRSLAAKFSRSVDQAAGQAKLAFSQMAKAYTIKATEFEAKALALGATTVFAGGISLADKLVNLTSDDRIPPVFSVGMDDDFLPVGPSGESNVPEPTHND